MALWMSLMHSIMYMDRSCRKRFFVDARKTHQGILLTDEDFSYLKRKIPKTWSMKPKRDGVWLKPLGIWICQSIWYRFSMMIKGFWLRIDKIERVNVTSAKSALNGYRKSRCFYCFAPITIERLFEHSADVDHFFPHKLRECDIRKPINGVANLVLSCARCNRGYQGKFDHLPRRKLLATSS